MGYWLTGSGAFVEGYDYIYPHLAGFTFQVTHKAVGGIVVPTDKLGILAPYIGFALAILLMTATTKIVYAKQRKKKQ
jgi:hypothetical protein